MSSMRAESDCVLPIFL